MGSALAALAHLSPTVCARLAKTVNVVIDSGATVHMWNDPAAFLCVYPLPDAYIHVADDRHLPVSGTGTIHVSLQGHIIQLHNVLLVPELSGPLLSVRLLRRLPGCSFTATNSTCSISFPSFTITIDDTIDVSIPCYPAPHSSTPEYCEQSPTASALVATRSGKQTSPPSAPSATIDAPSTFHRPLPPIRPCDVPNSSMPSTLRLTQYDLHRYLGFRALQDYKVLESTSAPGLHVVNDGAPPLDLGDVATIPRGKRGRTHVKSNAFLDDVYSDIGYGDGRAPRGFTHCLVLVDSYSRFAWIYGLKGLASNELIHAFSQFFTDAASTPNTLHADFDHKLIGGDLRLFLLSHRIHIHAAPSGRQSQNGLVEGNWKTIVRMSRSFLTDRLMPKRFWFFAVRHAAQILNYCPGRRHNHFTTPFEMAHQTKPDLRILFRLFTIGFFRHVTDSDRSRTQFEAQTITGIAVGRSPDSNAMEFYNPTTNSFYVSADYKLDPSQSTAVTFPQLKYDWGITLGLYSRSQES